MDPAAVAKARDALPPHHGLGDRLGVLQGEQPAGLMAGQRLAIEHLAADVGHLPATIGASPSL